MSESDVFTNKLLILRAKNCFSSHPINGRFAYLIIILALLLIHYINSFDVQIGSKFVSFSTFDLLNVIFEKCDILSGPCEWKYNLWFPVTNWKRFIFLWIFNTWWISSRINSRNIFDFFAILAKMWHKNSKSYFEYCTISMHGNQPTT